MGEEQKVTIITVDDDDGHTELVRRSLRRAGIRNPVLSLKSGTEALDFVFRRGSYRERPTDGEIIILLDINMPGGVDGVEVLRQIKANRETKRIPVIMLTTTDDPREVNRCYELGCSIYIAKPVEPSAFIEAIQRLGLFISIVSLPSLEAGR